MTKEYAIKISCVTKEDSEKENIFVQMLRKNHKGKYIIKRNNLNKERLIAKI